MRNTSISLLAIATILMVASVAHGDSPSLLIDIEVPEEVMPNEPFEVRITVSNVGEDPVVFKRHWKWAENTWFFEAHGPDGVTTRSTPALFDIAADTMCSHFVPLFPGDTFSTTTIVNHQFTPEGDWPPDGAENLPPELSFDKQLEFTQPGPHLLRLVYVSDDRATEQHCASGGYPVWKGKLESPWSNINVVTR